MRFLVALRGARAGWAALFAAVVCVAGAGGCRSAAPPTGAPGPPPAGAAPADVPVALPGPALVDRAALADYVGDDSCGECHQKETTAYRTTHHAVTLSPADDPRRREHFRQAKAVRDSATGASLTPCLVDGRPAFRAKLGARERIGAARWALGSGRRGVTYLGPVDDRMTEFRLSYYRERRRWEFSPNQPAGARPDTPLGRLVDDEETAGCFRCHSTAVLVENGRPLLEESRLGIGCETCHGPARRHVEAARAKEMELHLPRLGDHAAAVSERVCGACHGPAEEPSLENPRVRAQLSRFQGLALSLSPCVTRGSRPLTCMSCHDPHRDARRGSFTAYNRVCASCHGRDSPSCPREPAGDCVSCHMPAKGIGLRGGPQYRTHWIGIW